jgi:anthranilate phosphoribosyltransferase
VTCRELANLLHDHLAGELPGHRRVAVSLHLLLCVYCRAATTNYRSTVRLARESADSEVDAEELERLVQAVLAAPRSPESD